MSWPNLLTENDLHQLHEGALRTLEAARKSGIRSGWTKVPPLLAQGGYGPLADGQVRANVPFERYVYYWRLLEEVTQMKINSLGKGTKRWALAMPANCCVWT